MSHLGCLDSPPLPIEDVMATKMDRPALTCLHCGENYKLSKSRGLCAECHADSVIREMYPPCRDTSYRGYGTETYRKQRLGSPVSVATVPPTDCLPGTEGKIQVMIERAKLMEPLFHPLDFGTILS